MSAETAPPPPEQPTTRGRIFLAASDLVPGINPEVCLEWATQAYVVALDRDIRTSDSRLAFEAALRVAHLATLLGRGDQFIEDWKLRAIDFMPEEYHIPP